MANNISLNIVANAQFQQVYAEVARLKEAMISLQKVSVGGAMPAETVSSIRSAQKAFDDAVLSTRAFQVQHVAMTDSVAKFGKQLESGRLSLNNYYKIWRDSAKGVSAELDALATQQARVNRSIAIADPLRPGYAKLVTDINATVTAQEKAIFYQRALNTALRDGAVKLIDFGKNTQWAGRQITVGLTMPLAMLGVSVAQMFKGLDQELTRMAKVYGTGLSQPTHEAITQIRGDITALAAETARAYGVAMQETASVAADLAATGQTGEGLVNATREAVRLATLGELDHAEAVKTVISLQNVYKLSSQGLTGAINFLNAVENQTSTSLQDLVDAIPRVGPVVAQLGGDFKETAAMMVAMKEAGVPAAQAANAIKSTVLSLINPTKAARDAFSSMNINLKDLVNKTGGDPVQMFKTLRKEMEGLNDLQKMQLLEKLFGKYQASRVAALIENISKVGSQTQTVFNLIGASNSQLASLADSELKQQTESASGRYKRMIESLKADLVPLGNFFLNTFTTIGNVVDRVTTELGKFIKAIGPAGDILKVIFGGGLAGALVAGPILMLVGLLANLAGNLLKGANYIRMFRQGMDESEGSTNRFLSGLKNMRNFFENLDLGMVAARNQMDLMPAEITSSAESFDILRKAIFDLTTQFELLATAQREAFLASGGSTLLNAAESLAIGATTKGQLRLPGFANGSLFVPGEGNQDSILSLLTPGETVIPVKQAKKYRTLLGMIMDDNLPGYSTGVKQVSNASGLVNVHGIAPEILDPEYLRSNLGAFPSGMQRNVGAATSAHGLSNYVFVAPESLNMGQMTGSQAGKYFEENPELAGSQLMKSIASSFPGAAKDPEVQKNIHSLVQTIASELKSKGEQLVSEGDFYNIAQSAGAAARTSAGAGSITDLGLQAAMSPTTLALYGGEENREATGQRYGMSKSTQETLFGTKNAASSYRNTTLGKLLGKFRDKSKYLLGIKSPAEETAAEIGLPIAQGVAKGVKSGTPLVEAAAKDLATKTVVSGHQVIQEALPGMESAFPGASKLNIGGGITDLSKSGLIQSAGSGPSTKITAGNKLLGKLRGASGKFGGGLGGFGLMMAGQMALPMVENMLPEGTAKNVFSGTASSAMTGAMIGSMVPVIGTGLGAAIGGVYGFLKSATDDAKQKQAETEAKLKERLSKHQQEILNSADNLADGVKKMLNTANVVGGTKFGVLPKTATEKRLATEAAASGYPYATAPTSTSWSPGAAGSDWTTESDKKKKEADARAANAEAIKHEIVEYDDLNDTQKAVGSSLSDLAQKAVTKQVNFKQFKQVLDGITKSAYNTHDGFQVMAAAIQKSGDKDAIAALTRLNASLDTTRMTAGQAYAAMVALQAGAAEIHNTEHGGGAAVIYKKNADQILKDFFGGTKKPTTPTTGLPDAATAANEKYNNSVKKSYEDLLDLMNKRADAQRLYNDEIKKTNDYEAKSLDNFNQMKLAQASGNYLQAAVIRQQQMSATADYKAAQEQTNFDLAKTQIENIRDSIDTSGATKTKIKSANVAKILGSTKSAYANTTAGIYGKISGLTNKTLTTLGDGGAFPTVGNNSSVVNITLNTTGSIDKKTVDYLTSEVKKAIKVSNAKTNTTNKVKK